jgi:hypothetical protein
MRSNPVTFRLRLRIELFETHRSSAMLRRLVQLISLCTAFVGLSAHADGLDPACWIGPCGDYWVYVGTLASGPGQGIVAARMDGRTGQLTSIGLVATITRPTWLTTNPTLPVLYSVSDPGNTFASSVYSLAQNRVTGALTVKNIVLSGGTGATHLAADGEID